MNGFLSQIRMLRCIKHIFLRFPVNIQVQVRVMMENCLPKFSLQPSLELEGVAFCDAYFLGSVVYRNVDENAVVALWAAFAAG